MHYSNKALKTAQNLRIMGHCYSGIDPKLHRQVYYSVCWSVMTYGMPLWYQLHAKGVKLLVKKLTKTQNVALRWIAGTFSTTPVLLLELFTGIAPVSVWLDFQLCNFMAHVSTVPASHPLRLLATVIPISSPHARKCQQHRPISENIHLLHILFRDFRPFSLFSPLLRLGHRIIDLYNQQLSVLVPKHPKKGTALFDQWLMAWHQDTLATMTASSHFIGTDALIKATTLLQLPSLCSPTDGSFTSMRGHAWLIPLLMVNSKLCWMRLNTFRPL